MFKKILAGTTALTLLGGSLVYAQQTSPAQPGNAVQQRAHLTPEQRAAFTETRISELKQQLQLKPAQEKNWQTFEAALHEAAKSRAARFEEFRKNREQSADRGRDFRNAPATPAEIADQKRLAAALDPLYKSFDDGQKQRFAAMFRVDGEGRHFWFRGGPRSQNERS